MTTYTNAAGRLSDDRVTDWGSSGAVDETVAVIHTGYDDIGRVRSVTSLGTGSPAAPRNQVEYIYDSWGNLIKEYQAHDGEVDVETTPSVQYQYDCRRASGGAHLAVSYAPRLVAVVYPDGREIDYNYAAEVDDIMSRLSSISDDSGTLASYKYLGAGQIVEEDDAAAKLTYLDSSGNVTGLDRFGRVVDQVWEDYGTTPTVFDEYVYQYDRAGNRVSKTNVLKTDHSLDETYQYDHLDRLVEWALGGATQETWSLDSLGNDLAAGSYNAANEETPDTGSSGYDAAGNMITLQSGNSAIYDAWNRLTAVKSGSTILQQNEYDGTNRRIQVFTNISGSTADVADDYYQGQQVIESDATTGTNLVTGGGIRAGGYQYLWSPRYIAAPILRDTLTTNGSGIDVTQRLFYLGDANYNVTGLMKCVSGQWQVVERYTYTPYGVVTARSGDTWSAITGNVSQENSTILFAGRKLDLATGSLLNLATGLMYYRARYYDAGLQRFINRDPLRADMNLYRYVGNNPVINTDPSGLIWALYDIPASCWKCNLVAFVLSGYASGWDTLLFNYWNSGNGGPSSGTPWELKPSQFGVFDTDGSQRASAWKFVEGSAKGLAANLKCGESKSGTFSQGKTSASSGTRMISGYQFWFDATYKVTKNCDADGNCTSIDVSATCNFHASDTVDFWNTPPKKNGQWDESGMFGALGIRITDRLVRACYPNGRGFNLTANLSDTKSWSIPCGKPCDKPPISSTNNPGLPHYGEPKW